MAPCNSNNCAGWNKRAGWNFPPNLINVQDGIKVQVGILGSKVCFNYHVSFKELPYQNVLFLNLKGV